MVSCASSAVLEGWQGMRSVAVRVGACVGEHPSLMPPVDLNPCGSEALHLLGPPPSLCPS